MKDCASDKCLVKESAARGYPVSGSALASLARWGRSFGRRGVKVGPCKCLSIVVDGKGHCTS